jgi:multiple sugar transport system substrate-binding protein
MILSAAVRVSKLKSEVTFDPDSVQLMLTPSFTGEKPSPMPIAGWCVGVWSGSQHKEGAGLFVEHMMSPEADSLWVTLGGQAPMRQSTVEREAEFFADPKNQYLGVMAQGFAEAGWPQPTGYKISGWRGDLNNVCQNVLANGMSLEDALAQAEIDFNERNAD